MQVQSPQPLCGWSADIPLLEDTPAEGLPQRQDIFQERCAAQSYNTITSTASPQLREQSSLSPSENAYAQRSVTTGAYYTGNVHAQHIGLAGFGVERSEKQIRCELGRLYKLLQRSEKYQTYREKQPALTPAEVVARDAAERKEQDRRKAQGLQQEKDKTVWPDFLEHAFWTALVKWPPMGRKKYMLEGTQRGRNELIQDSIYRDTGIRRDRKQVSSHLQVLKDKLKGVPAVLLYMATPEDVSKRRCANTPGRAFHSSHMHGRQHAQRTESVTKSDYSTSSPHVWPQHVDPQSDLALSPGSDIDPLSSPFTVAGSKTAVDGDYQSVHCSAQMHSNDRLDSSDVIDLASWCRQYREFDFLRAEAEDWIKSGRQVLVGTAFADLMADVRPDADFTFIFDLHSHLDLSRYDYLECMTRFFDNGDNAVDSSIDNASHDRRGARTACEYHLDPRSSKGLLRVKFAAQPWARQIINYQSLRLRNEESVAGSLQCLTATQHIYGVVAETSEAQCLTTVLWRFQQTSDSAETGSVNWRAISFASCRSAAEERWCHETQYKAEDIGDRGHGHDHSANFPTSTPPDVVPYYGAAQLPLNSAQPHTAHHSYETEPRHAHHPPPLSIDILESMQPDLDHLDTSAATTTTEFSQQSFAISHTPGMTSLNTHANRFDFNGGQTAMSGAFEPAMNVPEYENFPIQSAGLEDSRTLAGMEHGEFTTMGFAVGEHGQLVPVNTSNDLHHTDLACYLIKPNWQHTHLVSHLEIAAEQSHSYFGHDHHVQMTQNHEVSHGHDSYHQIDQKAGSVANGLHEVNHSFWGLQGLQSPCQEDPVSGAANETEYRRDQTHSSEYGVPDLIEKDQGGRDQGRRGY